MSLLDRALEGASELHLGGLTLVLLLLVAVIVAARRFRLGISRDAIVAVVRGAVQLSVVALVFIAVVEEGHLVGISLVLAVMVVAAGWTAAERAHARAAFPVATLVIVSVTALLVAPLVRLGPFETRPLFLVPVIGIVLGNAMNATALGIDRMQRELAVTLPLIEARLALGVTDRVATQPALTETTRTAMLPFLNTFKTVGLVHLPGVMTGMLIAGASPIAAAEMQFVIIAVLFVAAGLSATIMAWWVRRRFIADLARGEGDRWSQADREKTRE